MTNVAVANRRHTPDWPYSDREMRLIAAAVRQEANPPAQRTGLGPVAKVGG
ncbi:hypothetical protein Ade02nite_20470 [Paractinoplanes deccanensis]|uniref:Uncharacterized protein n=1 Tax=Paractinoplanes deccanensis TaxID=113561 RepID=A0ABQ3Y092_9ACTN|nr:hypothetical protein [Actinoplanes deccanensis]GID73406.1 hypothetical protein Ade02nite_20470 [Actinoplanes deccanensis]